MMRGVCFVWLSIIVTSVASNPVSQLLPTQQCSTYQPNQFKNINSAPSTCQSAASQTSPYAPPITVQNQTPNESGLKRNLNEVLISKIFKNPSLQKILDPNTKLYNQNGQEIQRQPNSGSVPSVINNYFIVPPEFFSLNDTETVNKSNNAAKKRKVSSGRKIKSAKIIEIQQNPKTLQEDEPKKRQKNNGRVKNRQKIRNQNSNIVIKEIENVEKEDNNVPKPEEAKKIKRRRKQGSSNKKENPIILTPSTSDKIEEGNLKKDEEISPVIENIKQKKPKLTRRKQSNNVVENLDITDSIDKQNDVLLKNKEITSPPITEKPPLLARKRGKSKSTVETENDACLKNIESPVDDCETKDLEENRHTRNSKTDKVRSESAQKNIPIPDDIIRNFYPYMHMGNNFYPNGNYPFNFEQFYQPYIGKNYRNNKKRKNKNSENEENNKESLPNIVKVKLNLKKKEMTTTENPKIIESIEELQLKTKAEEIATQSSEEITNTSVEIAHEVTSIEVSKEDAKMDTEPESPKTKLKLTKADLEMPPTVIEDLHEFITPELGKEDIVPTLHTNGIINDYYPIFFDEAHYGNDESYYMKDLEDDRHFYTTDRGHEDLLNRERRKYDSNDDYRVPNLDIKDRTNMRRGFKYRMKNFNDDEENTLQRPYTHDRITQQINVPTKAKTYEEVQFQTPPQLENPDFRTRKVEKTADIYSDEYHEEICHDYSSEINSDKCKTYSDIEFPQYKMTLDTDKIPSTNVKSKNDRIETVFAKTRVVKYGVTKDDSEEKHPISKAHEDEGDTKFYSDGHTTFVVAKSLGQVDDYYW